VTRAVVHFLIEPMSAILKGIELDRLKWSSRRGLLENDLVLQAFYRQYESALTPDRVKGLSTLLEMEDNDLWDLVTGRAELLPEAGAQERDVLQMLRDC
jgi:antitoxin CptB